MEDSIYDNSTLWPDCDGLRGLRSYDNRWFDCEGGAHHGPIIADAVAEIRIHFKKFVQSGGIGGISVGGGNTDITAATTATDTITIGTGTTICCPTLLWGRWAPSLRVIVATTVLPRSVARAGSVHSSGIPVYTPPMEAESGSVPICINHGVTRIFLDAGGHHRPLCGGNRSRQEHGRRRPSVLG